MRYTSFMDEVLVTIRMERTERAKLRVYAKEKGMTLQGLFTVAVKEKVEGRNYIFAAPDMRGPQPSPISVSEEGE